MPLVYIILVNYNGFKDTIECVNSLKNINYNNYKIIIVDNFSSDNSLEVLREKLKDCIIIQSKSNLGFAGGNNLGIKYALNNNAEYVLLLNNDTIVEKDFLYNMISSFDINNKIGLIGCKIMYYPQKDMIWYGGGYVDWFKFIGVHYGRGQEDKEQYNTQKEIDFVTGCCMLVKKETFEKVGLLLEDYFMYFEDLDFCVKVKDSGYKIWYNPKAIIYHKIASSSGGSESPFSIEWGTKNRLLFMNKYKDRVNVFNFVSSKVFFYFSRFIRYFQYYVKGERSKCRAILNGISTKI